jgi:hypothetical protein
MKARERERAARSTRAKESGQKVVAAWSDLISGERYTIQLHDQIRLTLTERGWVTIIAAKDGSLVRWMLTSDHIFRTPEEALAYLRKHHDI